MLESAQHRFALVHDGRVPASEAVRQALATVGVHADTPATVLCDGDAGLWRLQREVLPSATIVLDWSHAAVCFEHALQAARSLGAGMAECTLPARRFMAWSGRSVACGTRTGQGAGAGLPPLCRWAGREGLCEVPASAASNNASSGC